MAATETTAPAQKRKAQGPRQEKPVFVIVSYTNEAGEPVMLDADRLNLRFTKDAAELVVLLTGANRDPNAVVKQAVIGAEKRASPAAPAATGEQSTAG